MNWAAVLEVLASGGVVGYPSETVWGLGVYPRFASALQERKGREEGKPFQVSCANVPQAAAFALGSEVLEAVLALLPGPLTVVTRARPGVEDNAAPGGWVGLRVPDHALALALLRESGPLLTSSLNPAGTSAARTFQEAQQYALADVLLGHAGQESGGLASTVVQLPAAPSDPVRVLRQGAFPLEAIRAQLRPLSVQVQTPQRQGNEGA